MLNAKDKTILKKAKTNQFILNVDCAPLAYDRMDIAEKG